MENVRVKMQGSGKKQQRESYLTQARIAFELTKEPHTYTQLRLLTKIHADILKRKLDYLTHPDRGIVFRHKHTCPDLESKKSYLRAAYTYDYYLLNWSKPEAKQLVDYYFDYSPEYLKVKMKEQESEAIAKIVEEKMKKPLKRKDGESEEDFNKRKEEIKEIKKQEEELLEKVVQRHKEYDKQTIEDLISYVEKRIRREQLLEQLQRERQSKENDTNSNSNIEVEQPANIRHRALLNAFIDFKINNMITQKHGYTYIDIWKIMEKEGFLGYS